MKGKTTLLGILVILGFIIFADISMAAARVCTSCTITPKGWCRTNCDLTKCTQDQCFEEPFCLSCNGGGGVDILPPDYTVITPIANHTYNSSTIEIEVQVNEVAKSIKYGKDSNRFTSICTNCNHATKILYSLSEGEHYFLFQVSDYAGNINEKRVYYKIDKTPPEILLTKPADAFFVAGKGTDVYSIKYNEIDVKKITLFHKLSTASTYSQKVFGICPSGEEQNCSVQIGSTYPQGTKINYYIEIKDSNFAVASAVSTVTVNEAFLSQPLKVLSPLPKVYDITSIPLNINVIEPSDIYQITDGGTPRKLCGACTQYTGTYTFKEGARHVVFEARTSAQTYTSLVDFTVETKLPKITKTEPLKGEFANGIFTVYYAEENLQEATLYYGNPSSYIQSIKTNCPKGLSVSCEFSVNLASFDNKNISYYFKLKDPLNTISSEPVGVKVDYTKPIITIRKPEQLKVYTDDVVIFDLSLSEQVVKLSYREEGTMSLVTLCSNCLSYNKTKPFKDGKQKVTFFAIDYAGNSNNLTKEFFVDSIEPKILKTTPADNAYTNGTFTVDYIEANIVETKLHITPQTGAIIEKTFNCPDAPIKNTCTLGVDLKAHNGKNATYYVTMKDRANNLVSSDVTDVKIDSVAPIITMATPVNSGTYSNYVNFNISLNEQAVKLSYQDNTKNPITLCSKCSSYSGKKYFSIGTHSIKVFAQDNGGNIATKTVSITVA